MHFIGIDLAWGENSPTGLAVLDDSGALVHIGAVQTDEEIVTALAPYVDGDVLVAIDAPADREEPDRATGPPRRR